MEANLVELCLPFFYSAVIAKTKLDYLMILFRYTINVKPVTLIRISY